MIPMHVIDSPIGSATAKIESDGKLVVKSADNFRDDSSQRHGHSDLWRHPQSRRLVQGGAISRRQSIRRYYVCGNIWSTILEKFPTGLHQRKTSRIEIDATIGHFLHSSCFRRAFRRVAGWSMFLVANTQLY